MWNDDLKFGLLSNKSFVSFFDFYKLIIMKQRIVFMDEENTSLEIIVTGKWDIFCLDNHMQDSD